MDRKNTRDAGQSKSKSHPDPNLILLILFILSNLLTRGPDLPSQIFSVDEALDALIYYRRGLAWNSSIRLKSDPTAAAGVRSEIPRAGPRVVRSLLG